MASSFECFRSIYCLSFRAILCFIHTCSSVHSSIYLFIRLLIHFSFFAGTVVTVVNLGDSRVVLGYVKEMYPHNNYTVRTSSLSTAGTTPEDGGCVTPKSSTDKRDEPHDFRTFNSPKHVQLSTDHKPDVPEERSRILKSGQFFI